ncbi:NUDIX domain-containing protein [Sporosarcina pasteurii]|uniref:RNA pyrophosphohydrolase n=1 Tax=Sporosarcina pasteurii TaxID=1474 RepID=A0A380CBW2_SPOPA|nr:NUDIX domain-containing protein [Sporosarcina pasteurii]MDS9473137.1 NUDIX domain-containing protein [Sporosarcina pasteurii]QBQ04218.1 NUDIX hydrolase [Sporosarcina pasteurii]SUJ17304.1 RNA pyrophosphohydrolase [Sporosarcina pasteurii]
MKRKRKVLAYITRGEEPNWELLVFEHKHHDAGMQVPGGTIENDELVIDALYREIEEETGIPREHLELKGKVNKTNYFPKNKEAIYERNIFHLAYTGKNLDAWEHRVKGEGKDKDMIFCLRFIPIKQLPDLAANQDQAIPLLI